MLELIALVVACLLNGLLGLVVHSKNPKSVTNRLFFLLTASFIVWSVVSYFSVHPAYFSQLTWIRLVLFCAAPLCLLVFLTFTAFPNHSFQDRARTRHLAIAYTLLVMGLTLTPLVFKSLTVTDGKASPVPGPAIPLFIILVFTLLGGGILRLLSKYHRARGPLRNQLRLIVLGLSVTFALIVVSNLVLVVAFNTSALVSFGPTFTLVFSGAFTYAIVRHHLFDIRAAAARGVGYVLTIGTLAVTYTLLVFGVSSLLLSNSVHDRTAQIVYTIMALVLAFSFQYIRQVVDRVTNSIFFKDSYDPQRFIDELNRVLVTHVELKELTANTIALIEHDLKSESCAFVIRPTAYFPLRIIGSHSVNFDEHDIKHLEPQMVRALTKVIVADELDAEHLELGHTLHGKNIGVVIRLVPSLDTRAESVGDIILGPKKNGDPYNAQDIRLLGIIANELVIAVQNALRFEEIENFNATLQQRVNDSTRKLRRANEKLKALDETKDDFISMASHQLRTPLTSVKGYISMVLEGDAGKINSQQKEMLSQAFVSSQRMVYLIADLLNVSRLKTGKFIIEERPVNLADIIQEELDQLEDTAASRSLKLQYDRPAEFPILQLDETKTRQVIMNFVDNAIYYTPGGGHITIQLIDKPHTVEFHVEDNGIGVPKHEQPHLFTKFYRAGNARKARPDGTGLGLFMAKKVIVAQGGALIFDSKEGKGSTFGFIFNKNVSRVMHAPIAVAEPPKPPKAKTANHS